MDYLKNLKQLVNINSYTQNKQGVDQVSLLMQGWLEEIGFKTKIYSRKHIGNHYLFYTKRIKKKPKILLLGHNDTVFPPNYFETYYEDKEYIYGPGVCDMKGGNIVALEALRNLYNHNKHIYNIDFLLVSDEETGSEDSVHISNKLAKQYDYCLTFEAAGQNYELVRSRNGVGRYTINIEGKASHAGVAFEKGIDANLEAAYKLQHFSKLSNLKKGTIINVGKIEGGIGINTVSPLAKMLVEFRFQEEKEKIRVMKQMEKIINTSYVKGSSTQFEAIIQRDIMSKSKQQKEFIKIIEKITNTKIKTEHRKGISDANIFAHNNVVTLDGFGPIGDGDHTKNERALKSSFTQRITMVTQILNYFQKDNK